MRPWKIAAPLLVAVALLIPAIQDTKKTKKPPKGAMHLVQMENWVQRVRIRTMESMPPQFAVILTVAMPTPGWKLTVDKLSAADADKRIRVDLRGKRPDGAWPQVITNTDVRVPLGVLPKGRYLLDVFGRYDAGEAYQRRGVVMVQAIDR